MRLWTWKVGKQEVLDKKALCTICDKVVGECAHTKIVDEVFDPWARLAGRHVEDDDGIVHRISRAFSANDDWHPKSPGIIEDCDERYFSRFESLEELPLTDKAVTCFACLSRGPE